jgi:hypothetical protein
VVVRVGDVLAESELRQTGRLERLDADGTIGA